MAQYPLHSVARRSGRRRPRRWLVPLLALALIVVGLWFLFLRPETETPPVASTQPALQGDVPQIGSANRPEAGEEAPPVSIAPPESTGTPEQQAAAREILNEGLALQAAGKPVEAREVLSRALLTGHLQEADAQLARQRLTVLAEKTIFSPRIYEGDPYAMPYTFREREVLQNVQRRLELYVPWQGLLRVNNLHSARRIRAGQTLKMIRGPFHAVVYKRLHAMDLFLHREELPRIFIRRFSVGLGRDDSTPVGSWRVTNKLIHADYYPAANSPETRSRIKYGEPGYAFGDKGLWIGLEGTDPNTRGMSGYGIHSTDEPDSIGHDASEGCIRLSDDDIDLVYALLYEGKSTVEIR